MKARVFPVFILGLCIVVASLGLLLTRAGAAHESPRPDARESFSPLGDTLAYMANGRATGLQVIEASDPVSPWEAGIYDTPGHVRDIVIQDRSGAEENNSEQSGPPPCLGNREVRIEVLPNTPTEGESVTLRISGISGDICVPEYLAHEIRGNWIEVYAGEPSCTLICATVLMPWGFDVELGALPPGLYVVRFYVVCQWPVPPPPQWWWCSLTTYTVAPCYDFNGNGQVDIEDIQGVVDRWRQPAGLSYDCDGDELITVRDIMCAVARWGGTCA